MGGYASVAVTVVEVGGYLAVSVISTTYDSTHVLILLPEYLVVVAGR